MTYLLLSLGIGLWPTTGRRYPARGERSSGRSLPLPLIAGVCAGLLVGLLGGRIGWALAGPSGYGAYRLTVRIMRRRRPEIDRRATALVLDLVAAALATGLPVDAAIGAVAGSVARHGDSRLAVAIEPFQLVGRLLALGCDPAQAWAELDRVDGLHAVASSGRRCAHSGARLADGLTDVAAQLRAEHRQRALARAQRTGVWTLLPLGLCFLPAFVCLGVAPVVIGVAGQLLGPGLAGGSALQ